MPVPPGDYDIRVVNNTGAVINVDGADAPTLPGGLVATVIARQGNSVGEPTGTGLILVTN